MKTNLKSSESRTDCNNQPMTFSSTPSSTINLIVKSKSLSTPLTQISCSARTKSTTSFMNFKELNSGLSCKCAAFGRPTKKDQMLLAKLSTNKNRGKQTSENRKVTKKLREKWLDAETLLCVHNAACISTKTIL
jgi:hypothetical protein